MTLDDDFDHAHSVEQAMEQELEDLILSAKKRPITDDEAAILFFHCGLPIRREARA